jgi:glycosyltransferase involved in cell wall biosynthesis
MRICSVSHKACWKDHEGRWFTDGGFPAQITYVQSLFTDCDLLITKRKEVGHGTPLPTGTRIVPLHRSTGPKWWRRFLYMLRLPGNVLRMLPHMLRAEILHVPCPGDIAMAAIVLALLSGKRTLFIYQAAWDNPDVNSRVARRLLMRYARRHHAVVLVGEGDSPPRPDFHFLFSTATTTAAAMAIAPRVDGRGPDPIRLVCAGRLSREKGLDLLVDAMSLLRRRLQNENRLDKMPHLELIGDGPMRGPLEQRIAELELGPLVSLPGQLPQAVVLQRLYGADLFVMPSLTEGFPKARLEGMLCGLPVITSDVGFAPAMIGRRQERGWIVPVGDRQALADQMYAVLMDESIDWPAMRQRCRAYAEERTLEAFAARLGQICSRRWGLRMENGKLVETEPKNASNA